MTLVQLEYIVALDTYRNFVGKNNRNLLVYFLNLDIIQIAIAITITIPIIAV